MTRVHFLKDLIDWKPTIQTGNVEVGILPNLTLIAGGTGSGKSHLCEAIRDQSSKCLSAALIVDFDDYCF